MASRVNPLNTWISIIALIITLAVYIITTSSTAGALQQRVKGVEDAQKANSEKLDKHTDNLSDIVKTLARIEQKIDDVRGK